MAQEVSFPDEFKKTLETEQWSQFGICGFLLGRVGKNRVFALNMWKITGSLISDLSSCQKHFYTGTGVIGVVIVMKSTNLLKAENVLEALPLEVRIAVSGQLFVVCIVQNVPKEPEISFYHLSAEDRMLHRLAGGTANLDELGKDQITFRLQAQVPLWMQFNTRSEDQQWKEKLDKAFGKIDMSVTSEDYLYRIRGTDIFLSSDENCVIGTKQNVDTIQSLYKSAKADTEYGSGHRKHTAHDQPVLLLDMFHQVSGCSGRFAQPTCAPAIHQKSGHLRFLQLTLPLDVVVEVDINENLSTLLTLLTSAIKTQLHAMRESVEQYYAEKNKFFTPEPFHFTVPNCYTCLTVIYPKNIADNELEKRRQYLHEKMCLGLDRPVFRRGSARLIHAKSAAGGHLINPHLGLPPSGVKGGTAHVVQGNYSYHHYMQDHFDDNKWGCAYRSLQTLVSWFRYQGYTERHIPSHKEIQEALVAVGDKEAKFVGSKKWIGSFEVSYCLNLMLGVTSRFLTVASGEELASEGRNLAQHFDTEGTPVMIGGGVLAHTILGVDYSEQSGEIKYLILDPHYVGGEDLSIIQKEGWCGWKDQAFWNQTAHYNLCLPLRPKCF